MTKATWTYYNHGWLPICAPHETPDLSELASGEIFSKGGILARYTTDFDCGIEKDWWYIIKDNSFDISKLKSKQRYVVKQGRKNFEVKIIDPCEFKEEIFAVAEEAFGAYPKKYRPVLSKEKFFADIGTWANNKKIVHGAFSIDTNKLAGYAITFEFNKCIQFDVLKTIPSFEKMQVNAALVDGILAHYSFKLENGYYICNGARNILHETNFPDYLIKYFHFRKAYCKLHVWYNPKFSKLIKLLYKLRKIFYKFDFIKKVHQLNGVLKMEEIVRNQN